MEGKTPAKPIGNMDIGELLEELASREAELADALSKADTATAVTMTSAIRAVSHVQKIIDWKLDERRRLAARGTHWSIIKTEEDAA